MFHSSGLFSGTLCPFFEHGLCHRPYCHYRHSRRERPAPRKRPQLKTRYTKFPSAEQEKEEASGVVAGASESGRGEVEEKEKAVFSFYGASGSESAVGDGPVQEREGETEREEGARDQPEKELPCYAPEMCLETVVGTGETVAKQFSEKEVKELESVTVEAAKETEPACDDVTEADIFGTSSDDDPLPAGTAETTMEMEKMDMREEREEIDEIEERDEREEERDEREGEDEREEREGGQDELKVIFQQAIQTAQTTAQVQKRPASTAEYPPTVQKKRRIALPNAELYRQNSFSAVKPKPTITSNFAATLDKDSLYMGRKRMALQVKRVDSKESSAPVRPTIPLKANSKIPTKLRQKYLDAYIDEILKVTLDPGQAYERAEKEEKELFEHCTSRMTYLSRAPLTLKRLRNEAKEFLQKQREKSDARVLDHKESGRSSEKATPTNKQPLEKPNKSEKMMKTDKNKKMRLDKNKSSQKFADLGSPTPRSPLPSPPLTPRIVERCKSAEVRVRRCGVTSGTSEEERGGDVIFISSDADFSTAAAARSFYSKTPALSSLGTAEKKMKNKKRDAGKVGREKSVEEGCAGLPVSSTTARAEGQFESQRAQHSRVGSTEALRKDLFGDSDSDCVMLSSSCSSGEEEIMNVSFEEALRGAERQRVGPAGQQARERGSAVKKKRTLVDRERAGKRERVGSLEKRERVGSSEKRERVGSSEKRERVGSSEKRERVGSSEKRERVGSSEKRERVGRQEQRRSSSGSVVEEPAVNPDNPSFKPDSQSLVNLTDLATRTSSSSSTPSLSSLKLSASSALRRGAARAPPRAPLPSTTITRPSCTIFKKAEVTLTAPIFYSLMKSYLMTEEQLAENGYPRPTSRVGVASINWGAEPAPSIQPAGPNAMRHRCCRCGKNFIIYNDGQYQTVEDCVHHYGRLFKVKEYGEGVVSQYSCCNERRDAGGCQVAKFHVTAGAKLPNVSGYVQTSQSQSRETVYALDCEMCYTTAGLELTRVSAVDMSLQPVYEATVLPPRPIVDYNTRFSGLTAENFVSGTTTLEEVQRQILGLVSADTILLGHGLESDLRSLKIIHSRVVDTAIVFPHRRGPPLKRALRNIMKDHLNKIIQDDATDAGHDSLEDARACMELMLQKTKADLQKTTRRGST